MADYIVEKDGWIAGRLRRAGDRLSLSARAAKYEHVRPAGDAAPVSAPAEAPAEAPADAPVIAPAPKRRAKDGA